MKKNPSVRSAAGACGLPREFVTSTDRFDQETDRIFSRNWICVARIEELDATSRCLPIQFENQALVLVQDESGAIRAFRNFCRHRGSQLVNEDNCAAIAKRIQCPYHAWTYDRAGQLLSAPNMEGVPGFNENDYPLLQVPCQSLGGFIWINHDPEQDVAEWIGPLTSRMKDWGLAQLKIGHQIEYLVEANWKLIFQNYSECYHCPIVHPALNRLTPYLGSSNDFMSGAILGGPMGLAEDSQTMSTDGKLVGEMLPGLTMDQQRSVHYFTLFPNLFLSFHPDYVLVHRLERVNVHSTKVCCLFLFDPVLVAQDAFDPGRAIEFWDLTNRQDWRVCELAQRGMSDPDYVPGPYSNLESVVAAFDQHYLQLINQNQN